MRLPEWESDVIIRVQFPDKYDKMSAPYLYVESRFGRVPWKETYIELFAENWQLVRLRQPAKTVEDTKNSIMNDINKAVNKQDEVKYQNQMNKETIDSIKKQQAEATHCCDCQCKKEDSSEEVAKFVKDLSVEFDIIVLASTHLRKLNGNRRPTLDDLRDSLLKDFLDNILIDIKQL